MTERSRFLSVIGLLVLAVAAVAGMSLRDRLGARAATGYEFVADIDNWQRTGREVALVSPYNFSLTANLNALPLKIGDWTGVDVPQSNLEVFILLEPEQYVQRLYERADGRSIWLSLIGSRKSKSFHSPQICYDTDGWQIDAGSEAIPLEQGRVFASRLFATKTYEDGGTARHAVMYFYLWPSYARSAQDGTVLVKLTAPVTDGDVNATLAAEKDLFRQLFVSAR